MSILDAEIARLDGTPATLRDLTGGKPALLVNVASKCGMTPQYEQLEALQRDTEGFTVVGFPCNQFGGQEPGTATEIAEFCSATYGVSFPMSEKIEVNGQGRHPIYTELTADAGDITWNFEKFVVRADGTIVERFGPSTRPDDTVVTEAIATAIRDS
ncbi:glutathione peroxidase [Microlunatus sp. Y2014]|uniref:glutathione peroxidase n=1 Tax=Microlunatus sp. Y2014 TaxID=3418488 RepID=UPI003DA76417